MWFYRWSRLRAGWGDGGAKDIVAYMIAKFTRITNAGVA